jgi:hypothetical protein
VEHEDGLTCAEGLVVDSDIVEFAFHFQSPEGLNVTIVQSEPELFKTGKNRTFPTE